MKVMPGSIRKKIKRAHSGQLKRLIVENRELKERLVRLEREPLTGLLNRNAFYEKAAMALKENPHKKYDLIAVNIEIFKIVNDIFGNEVGDKLLKYLSDEYRKLRQWLEVMPARIRADRFCFLAPRSEDFHKILIAHTRMVETTYPLSIKIHTKLGVYQIEDCNTPVSTMCDRAHLAADSIKGVFGKSIAFYDDTIRKTMLIEKMMIDSMHQAINKKEFQVFLQPQYDLVSHCLTGAEALVRWQHPVMGLLAPMQFISVFEQHGIIQELDLYMFESVCSILEEWARCNGKWVPISVNLSRQDIYDNNLPELLYEIVVRHHLTPCQIHLEITESAYTEESEQLILTVTRLREIGFVVEMDDFGKGYSSLNLLAELPVDVLKLDMRFLYSQNRDRAQTIMGFVIALAKQLKLQVIAEGVEAEEQVTVLNDMGCHLCQGFYFGRPEPVEQFWVRLSQEEILSDFITERSQQVEYPNQNHPETLIIVTQDQLDCRALCDYFKDHYTIIAFSTWGEIQGLTWDFIQCHKKNISAMIFALNPLPFYGYGLIKKIRNSRDLEHIRLIPIVDVEKEKAAALEMGAADYIVRPFYKEVVTAKVEKVIREFIRYQEAEERAKRDSMIYLYHHASVETMIKLLLQEGITKGAFILVDVDDFKRINDELGHPIGDEVICEIAGEMKSHFEDAEIIGRIGGDEFAVFLTDYDYMDGFILKMVERFRKEMDICRNGIQVTCSVGVSFYPQDGRCYEALYGAADRALLQAKSKKLCLPCIINDKT